MHFRYHGRHLHFRQMNAMSVENGVEPDAEGGPMWGRFFESLGHEDSESLVSGSNVPGDYQHSRLSRSISHLIQSPNSEVHPNDSASVVDDDQISALDGFSKRGGDVPSITGINPPPPVDDGTYVFKFRTPSGRTHRFQARNDHVENLREIVAGKLATDPFFTQYKVKDESELPPDPTDFQLAYTDADGDIVLITSDSDVSDAVKGARTASLDRVVLFIQGGKGWQEIMAERSVQQAAELAAAKEEANAPEKVEPALAAAPVPAAASVPAAVPTKDHVHFAPVHVPEDKVLGIPKDLLLPASIGALAAVILGVFTVSRLSR